jgi:hypothetical protein
LLSVAFALIYFVPVLVQICEAVAVELEGTYPVVVYVSSPQSNVIFTLSPSLGSTADVEKV